MAYSKAVHKQIDDEFLPVFWTARREADGYYLEEHLGNRYWSTLWGPFPSHDAMMEFGQHRNWEYHHKLDIIRLWLLVSDDADWLVKIYEQGFFVSDLIP